LRRQKNEKHAFVIVVGAVSRVLIDQTVNTAVGNVTSPRPGRGTQRVELDVTSYTTLPDETDVAGSGGKQQVRADKCWWRGLWAQCRGKCQLFWQHDYQLQSNKFTPLRKDTRHITFKHY